MSIYATKWAYAQNVTPAGRKFVLVALADFADAEGRCFPGQDTLAVMTGQDERSIRRHMDALEEAGLIRREERRRSDGSRTTDVVYLLAPTEALRPEAPVRATGQNDRLGRAATGQSVRNNRTICPTQPDKLSGHEPSVEPSVEEERAAATTGDATPSLTVQDQAGLAQGNPAPDGATADAASAATAPGVTGSVNTSRAGQSTQPTSTPEVPAARGPLVTAFGQAFLDTLLAERLGGAGWLALDPAKVAELHQRALVEGASKGKAFRTLLIGWLDAEAAKKPTPTQTQPASSTTNAVLARIRGGSR